MPIGPRLAQRTISWSQDKRKYQLVDLKISRKFRQSHFWNKFDHVHMEDASRNNQIQDVKVYFSGNFLGRLTVSTERSKQSTNPTWEGQILGSDYLVWGLNHKKVNLQFEDGSGFDVIVRPGGKIFRTPEWLTQISDGRWSNRFCSFRRRYVSVKDLTQN